MIRILSMDGGPGPAMQLYILQHLEKKFAEERPSSFLEQVDLFAGTSDGALMSLYLAHELTLAIEARERNEPAKSASEIIKGCIKFSGEIVEAFRPVRNLGLVLLAAGNLLELTMAVGKPKHERAKFASKKLKQLCKHMLGMLGSPLNWYAERKFLLGEGPFVDTKKLKKILEEHFGDRTLGSLRKNVAVVSFDSKRWSSRVFCNAWARDVDGQMDDERDLNRTLVDVAMCTASLPLMMPVFGGKNHHGYLDGLFSANNPAMAATSLAIRHLKVPMDQLRVLSLGITQTAEEVNIERRGGLLALITLLAVDDRDARLAFIPMTTWERVSYFFSNDARQEIQKHLKLLGIGPERWGWFSYLMRPTLLFSLLLHGMGSEESFQCERLLGGHFHRFAPRINFVRLMFRTMGLRWRISDTDLPWNAKRCVDPHLDNLSPSTDETNNADEYKKFCWWLRENWWTEQPPQTGQAPAAQA